MITLVAAVAANGVIGNAGRLPWSIPDDLRQFRRLTIGKPVIMGRATFDSIGRPLPERTNIVLTRNRGFAAHGTFSAADPDEAVAMAQSRHGTDTEICVIGGGEVYTVFLPRSDRLELTLVALAPEGDAFFPEWDRDLWKQIAASSHTGPPQYQFTTWVRAATAAF